MIKRAFRKVPRIRFDARLKTEVTATARLLFALGVGVTLLGGTWLACAAVQWATK